MTPTGNIVYRKPVGDTYEILMQVVGPASYVHGTGFQVQASDFGLNVAEYIELLAGNEVTPDLTAMFKYDPTTGYVKCTDLTTTPPAEIANATNLSAITLYFRAKGKD